MMIQHTVVFKSYFLSKQAREGSNHTHTSLRRNESFLWLLVGDGHSRGSTAASVVPSWGIDSFFPGELAHGKSVLSRCVDNLIEFIAHHTLDNAVDEAWLPGCSLKRFSLTNGVGTGSNSRRLVTWKAS
ncbi:hypothetical protein OB236_13895 [Paenibacillus sp. WQ 127069]|uniref:Uncharacterized protein n=1 Tax=Paenibacillus baimaensis TaxID=2982185 RepID=A0ABT2UGP4_9BACL|nr:hypothetical protein [Paenibacillus sp. WQ 127069]MCU6793211.1 hypothetical protein [Paenibacillus sp. WQ 127069]